MSPSGPASTWSPSTPRFRPRPIVPDTPIVDTVATLAFVAGATERIRLASGILLLPQRNPVVLAKELAGIDVLSGGRLIFGVGVGYVKGEFDTMGVPFEERGPRTSEHIEVIRTLWTSDQPTFDGRFTSFSGIQSYPHPVQTPHPPIVIGGSSPPALRRTITQGNGWYGFMLDVDGATAAVKALEQTAQRGRAPRRPRPPRDHDHARVAASTATRSSASLRPAFTASSRCPAASCPPATPPQRDPRRNHRLQSKAWRRHWACKLDVQWPMKDPAITPRLGE